MILKGYTVLTKEEFKESLDNDEEIEVFTNLETLLDVHGEYSFYSEIDYEDGNPITYSIN